MNKFSVIALANTFAIIDLILHPLFHLWTWVHPDSYVWLMQLFVAGLHLQVSEFDSSFEHIIIGTMIEATIFWCLGAAVALIYNKVSR